MEKALEQLPVNLIKVVLFGPESTGKTTMSELLAKHYNTVWVAEYAREYLQEKWNNERKTCEDADLIPIAKGQIELENKLALKADKVLICDTDLLETLSLSFLEPDYTFFMNLDPAESMRRIEERGEGVEHFETREKLNTVRNVMTDLAERCVFTKRATVLNAGESREQIASRIDMVLAPILFSAFFEAK